MKIAYFDCFSGISGDMIIGALLDTRLELDKLEHQLHKLNLPGYSLSAKKVTRNHISGTKFDVEISEDHHRRNLPIIETIIDSSELSDGVKKTAKSIFRTLAEAESKIHAIPIGEVHFHEVGAVDSIVDIVGIAIALELLDIKQIYASKIHIGSGFVNTQHGKLPVPAPATMALLEGKPVYSTGIKSELVTPTGAATLATLATAFGDIPSMTVSAVGYGAGTKKLPIPNLLRVVIGESDVTGFDQDEIILIETNIDDASPEIIGNAQNILFDNGALDVYTSPIYMKKNRAATKLSVIATPQNADRLAEIIFEQTTTFGLRISKTLRKILNRRIESVETVYGPVKVKIGEAGNRIFSVVPEYEDCRRVAEEHGVPLRLVYDEVTAATQKQFSE